MLGSAAFNIWTPLATIGGIVTAGAVAWVTWLLGSKDRHEERKRIREQHAKLNEFLSMIEVERLRATIDAVLGRPADPSGFPPRIVPLSDLIAQTQETVTILKASIGHVNGSGKTVMDLLAESSRAVDRIGNGQLVISERLEDHVSGDLAKFKQVEMDIREMRQDIRHARQREDKREGEA